ncbi:MAG: VWA domain-containing protein [SAR324 cluster bacterium]|nr:VWA domain-containing protein [SAR324 cluster bacterium]
MLFDCWRRCCLLLLLSLWLPGMLDAQGTNFFRVPKKQPPVQKEEAPPPPPTPVRPPPKPQLTPPPPANHSVSDVIFLLDTSGSMDAFLPGQKQSKLKSAQKALDFFALNMLQGTRFQLWSFNARLTQHPNSPAAKSKQIIFEEIGPSGSVVRQHLQQQIAGLETRGGTNLYQAIFEALRYFRSPSYQVPEANVKRFPVVVLLADGQDDGYSAINRTQVLQKRKQVEEVEVKVIGFGVTPNSETHRQLCELARPAADCLVTSSSTELQTLIRSFTRS